MRESGKNIVMNLQAMRKLCEGISELLGTADQIMLQNGWRNVDSLVIAGLSYTLARPRSWIPQDVFRFYTSKNILAFFTVILDDWEGKSEVKESLLTAGWFEYDSGDAVPTQGVYKYARWHLKMPDRNDNGNLTSTDSRNWPRESFVRVSTLGVPLMSLNAPGLEGLITRLIDGIKSTVQR
jgi:hypothetical protein